MKQMTEKPDFDLTNRCLKMIQRAATDGLCGTPLYQVDRLKLIQQYVELVFGKDEQTDTSR